MAELESERRLCFRCVLLEHKDEFKVQTIKVFDLEQPAGWRGQGSEVREGSGVSRLFSHRSKANLVPVLTRSTSGPLTGGRLTNTVGGSVESLRAPSVETCDTLETQHKARLSQNFRTDSGPVSSADCYRTSGSVPETHHLVNRK